LLRKHQRSVAEFGARLESAADRFRGPAEWGYSEPSKHMPAFRRSECLDERRSRCETPQRNRNDLGETSVNKTRQKRLSLEEKSTT
jgi:hypothetical protein